MLYIVYVQFGEKLKILRKNKGWTQVELAEKLKVKQQLITNYERGLMTPTVKRLKKIADIFETTTDELLSNKKPKVKKQAKKRVHKNSREAQMTEYFRQLPPQEQRLLLKMAETLIAQKKAS